MSRFTDSDIQRLTAQLKHSEGLRLDAYRCKAGALTVGYGHNCDASPLVGVNKVGDRISQEMAEDLLKADMATAIWAVRRALPWVEDLDPPRQAVLFDMAFNMGLGNAELGLLSFKNALRLVREGHYAEASRNMLVSAWAVKVKGRALRLSRQMATGEWQ